MNTEGYLRVDLIQTVEQARTYAGYIIEIAARGQKRDLEDAWTYDELLRHQILKLIAGGHTDPKGLAEAALLTSDTKLVRPHA